MSQKLIRKLYEQRLATWAAAEPIQVAWQNVAFDPPANAYVRAFLLPGDTESDDLQCVHRGYYGVFQVSVLVPNGMGSEQAEEIAGEIDALYPNNLRLTTGAFTVQIVSPCSIGTAIQGETHYLLPVWFRYRADTI